jgi:hypothetical protein
MSPRLFDDWMPLAGDRACIGDDGRRSLGGLARLAGAG